MQPLRQRLEAALGDRLRAPRRRARRRRGSARTSGCVFSSCSRSCTESVGVAVVEPDDHAERDHVLAHRVDERAAELAVALRRARSGQPIVWMTRSSGCGTFQTSFTPSAQTCGFVALRGRSARARRRSGGPACPRRGRHAGDGCPSPGSKFGELLAVPAAAAVAGADADARGRRSTSSFAAAVSGRIVAPSSSASLGEPAPELRERGDVVAVVPHRRRRRDPQRALRASGSRRPRARPRP